MLDNISQVGHIGAFDYFETIYNSRKFVVSPIVTDQDGNIYMPSASLSMVSGKQGDDILYSIADHNLNALYIVTSNERNTIAVQI